MPLRKRHFSLEIASYRERQRWQASEGAPTRKPRTRKQVSLTLRIIKSVVEAFGEGESSPAMAPGGQGIRTAVFASHPPAALLRTTPLASKPVSIRAFLAFYQIASSLRKRKSGFNAELTESLLGRQSGAAKLTYRLRATAQLNGFARGPSTS